MAEEKFNVQPEDQALAKALRKMFPEMPISIIEDGLTSASKKDFLEWKERIAKDIHESSGELLKILQEKKDRESGQKFPQIEQEVMASLPSAESKRISTTIALLRRRHGDEYDVAYQEAIIKLHRGEVVIKENSVQFLYAHAELDKQELQFPNVEKVLTKKYPGLGDLSVIRKEIRQMILDDEQQPAYRFFQEAKAKAAQQGKYMATKENAFAPILSGFTGELDQQIKGLQILR